MDVQRKEREISGLAFPARWISGRPAFAVTHPFLWEDAVIISIAVHFKGSGSLVAEDDGLGVRHVRLSSTGSLVREGCFSLNISSSGMIAPM